METFDRQKTLEIPLVGDGKSFKISSLRGFCAKSAPKRKKEGGSPLFRRSLSVEKQIDEAHAVVMGKQDWNPTQARVFTAMLNKVMPDLTAQFVQHEHQIQEAPEKMSREQLEAIASGMNQIIDGEAVEEEE